MKFIKGLLITVLVLLVLVFVGAYIFLKSFDINKYRGQITAEISKQTGRTVAIDNLGLNLSLFKGIYAEASGIKMSEDSAFGEGNFLSIDSVHVTVDVMAYLSRHEIIVPKVVVAGLNLNVIRDGQGVMNVQKIGLAPAAVPDTQTAPAASGTSTPPAIAPFTVQKIALENGTIVFTDKGMNPPMQINLSKIDFLVNNFSLKQPFTFNGTAAVIGSEKNVSLKGQVSIDMATQAAQLNGLEVEFDLAKLAIADLVKAVPQIEAAGLTAMQGKLVVQVPSLNAGAAGLGELEFKGQLQNGKIATKMLPVPLEAITADFSANVNDFMVNHFSTHIATGEISGVAKIADYMKTMGLNAEVKVNALPLSGLVANLPEGMTLGGAADADLTITGQNLANPDLFLGSMNGSGQFNVKDGKIENFNVLKTMLGRIPGVAASFEASIPQQYRADYVANQTIFQKIGSSIQITNGVIDMPDMQVLSNLFEANMQIRTDSKLYGKVSGQLKIPADLSASLSSQAAALDYLKDGEGKITISITSFEGPLASMKIMPDVKELGKVAIQGEGKRQLGNLIDKALGVDKTAAPEGEESAPKPGEQIIGGVLDKIFK